MRITQGIIHRNFLTNLNTITNKINKKFEQISSGKRIVRPSDDPVSVSRIMKLKDQGARSDQYKRNIDVAIGWLKMTESAFNSMEDVIKRLEEIAISTGSDNASSEARKTAAEEIARLKEHAIMIANTRFRGHYIFAGFLTNTPPFNESNNDYHGDDNKIEVEVDNGVRLSYNVSGSVFTQGINIFQLMDDIKTALNNNNPEAIRSSLDKIHDAFNQVNIAHTGLGSKIKSLENIKEDLSNRDLLIDEIISNKEDTDMAEAIPRLYMYQSAYQALLYSFTKITSVNLFNMIG